MIYQTGEFNVCDDCLLWLANGDASGLDYHYPDTAAALLERIQEGERNITEWHGHIHIGDAEEDRDGTAICECCGRFERIWHTSHKIRTFVDPVGRTIGGGPGRYLDVRFILETVVDLLPWQKAGLSYTATGYGSRIPTQYKFRCADNRTRRVYAVCYSNAASYFVEYKGDRLFLDADGETKLEHACDAAA